MTVSYQTAADALRMRLGDRSFMHCERVAECASELARVYGVDVETAALAGLLHDWDKDLDDESLWRVAEQMGLDIHPEDEVVPALLHARTGAAGARQALGELPDDVICAIERHTSGALDMSPLDMVVYIADMIEPGRTHEGLDALRDEVGSVPIEVLFASAYRQSMLHLVKNRKVIHPAAVEVWNAYVPRGRA